MAGITEESKQTWIPYQPTKDCSMGFCSIYCHHWCYLVFPPPPPALLLPHAQPSRLAFSPLAIAIVGVLVAAFLLVSYFAIITKSCGRLDELLSSLRRRQTDVGSGGEDGAESLRRREAWRVLSPRHGLEQAMIDRIAPRRYRWGGGGVDGTDCSICLGEFREDESLRLLPKCGHAFHLPCIDTWLKSHSNCPLCRVAIAVVSADPPPLQSPASAVAEEEFGHAVDVGEERSQAGGTAEAIQQTHGDMGGREGSAIVEVRDCNLQSLRRSSSMSSLHSGRNSIREMMEVSREEFLAAEESSSSSISMKRSSSSGRFGFGRNGGGRNAILPM